MQKNNLFIVDAFASTPFRGNPASVYLLEGDVATSTLQSIAAEMNHSETAFVKPLGGKNWLEATRFSLRWFTPTVEVELCGHATLATSCVLFTEVGVKIPELVFETLSGDLRVTRGKASDLFVLNFPIQAVTRTELPHGMKEALGLIEIQEVWVAKNSFYVVRVPESCDLTKLNPDFSKLKEMVVSPQHGVIVTRKGPAPFDFTSRMFAPWIGINEDPVTGAAHTVLAPYWEKILGKRSFRAFQSSPRGGEVGVELLIGDRVGLSGKAVTVVRGVLTI